VFVDNKTVAGAWTLRPAATDTGLVELHGGGHDFRVEYYNYMNPFLLRLEIIPRPPGGGAPPAAPPDPRLTVLDQRIVRNPGDAAALSERGQLLARKRRFPEAAADLRHAIELGHKDLNLWVASAALLLRDGDDQGYRRHCRLMLDHFGDTNDRWTRHKLAEACAVAPRAVDAAGLEQASALIDAALADPARRLAWRHRAYMALTEGMVEYRRGRYTDAAKFLEQALALPANSEMEATSCLFLAMTRHHLGDQASAKELLRRGAAVVDDDLSEEGVGDLGNGWFGTGWTMWLHAHAARREAEGLIRGRVNAHD
jgi:tetratricopeptide (TPR) repeat protein